MKPSISQLIERCPADDFRNQAGFSPEMEEAHKELFKESPEAVAAIMDWLQRFQPCIFGRAAAKLGLVDLCILTADDLQKPDDHIRDRIQTSRIEWRRSAMRGHRSGFVIACISPTLVGARPGEITLEIARRICEAYLLTTIAPDEIYLDDLFLELPTDKRELFHWRVGVNFFAAAADKRWWHDHRFPGGIAFSMNSIGHLVRSRQLARAAAAFETALELSPGEWVESNINTLPAALNAAMRTIRLAAATTSGPATFLKDASTVSAHDPPLPTELPRDLKPFNHCSYNGWYHTDITLPSEYFRPDVSRPDGLHLHELDFTYLFHDDATNPDHQMMGLGVQIREAERKQKRTTFDRSVKSIPDLIDAEEAARIRSELHLS